MKKISKMGFTLVELLAVIIVISLIGLIIVPKISEAMENAKKDTFIKSVNGLINAVKLDMANGKFDFPRYYEYDYPELYLYGIKNDYVYEKIKTDGMIEGGYGWFDIDSYGEMGYFVIGETWCATNLEYDTWEILDEMVVLERNECD